MLCSMSVMSDDYELDLDRAVEELVFLDDEESMDTLDLGQMPEDFLVAGPPYTKFELFMIRVGSYLLYSAMAIKKGITYSYDKTLRVFRMRR